MYSDSGLSICNKMCKALSPSFFAMSHSHEILCSLYTAKKKIYIYNKILKVIFRMRMQISIIPNIQQTLRLKKHKLFLQNKSYNFPSYTVRKTERHHLGDLEIDWRIILKCMSKKQGVRIWSRFSWFGNGSNGWLS